MIRHTLALGLLAAFITLPAHADDDRFVLRIGALQTDTDTKIRASTALGGEEITFEDGFELGNDDIVPRAEAMFRLGERHRLHGNYLRYDRDEREELGEDIAFEDVLFPAGSVAKAGYQFDLASVMYEFAAIETEQLTLGLQLGAYWANAEAKASAQVGDQFFEAEAKEDGYSPAVGARIGFSPSERWRIGAQAQYFDEKWGNFSDDVDGTLSRANALVEYRFTETLGVYAGYDWFRLKLSSSGSDGEGDLDLRFKGPMAGVTFAF